MHVLDPQPRPRIMIVGYGDLGKKIANALVLDSRVDAIGITGRSAQQVERDANLLRFTAMNHGWTGDISCYTVDLEDMETAVAALRLFQPTTIVNTASVQSWRRLTELPGEMFRELDEAQYGPWLPMHLAPARSLMLAVREWGAGPIVLNAAYPDAVGAVLRPHGLAPTIGGGNVANVVPAITWSAARVLGLPVTEVEVRLVAQHYYSHRLPRYGDAGEAPAVLEIRRRGQVLNIADELSLIQHGVSTFCRRTGGIDGQSLTASSVLTVVRALMSEQPRLVHAPAPDGLPGGYPVMASRDGFELSLPRDLSTEDAVRINQMGQYADGVQDIDERTGVATIRPEKLDILRRRFPVDGAPLDPADAWQRAQTMHAAFAELLAGCAA